MSRFRLGLSLAGLLIAVLALALDDRRLIWVAIAILGTSLAIRACLAIRDRRVTHRNPPPPGPDA
jgi:hypothetical protein